MSNFLGLQWDSADACNSHAVLGKCSAELTIFQSCRYESIKVPEVPARREYIKQWRFAHVHQPTGAETQPGSLYIQKSKWQSVKEEEEERRKITVHTSSLYMCVSFYCFTLKCFTYSPWYFPECFWVWWLTPRVLGSIRRNRCRGLLDAIRVLLICWFPCSAVVPVSIVTTLKTSREKKSWLNNMFTWQDWLYFANV